MSNSCLFLCGEVNQPEKISEKKIVHLKMWGKDSNVNLRIHDINRMLAANIPDILLDLVEFATYVYCADQAVSRGGNGVQNMGKNWRRDMRFIVPVRKPDFWSSTQVTTSLRKTLGFLSDDNYEFEFEKLLNQPPRELYFEFEDFGSIGFNPAEVVLFSGGLDSLSGAVQECVVQKKQTLLVSHRSTSKLDSKQRNLVDGISACCPENPPFHIPVWINKSGFENEFTQRTRSFLYASLAAAVAQVFKLDRIRFYENGVISLNLPITEQIVGAKATRTTHPQVINGFADIFSQVYGKAFTVENPFLWKTKTEVVNLLGDAGCANLIKDSISCTHTRDLTKMHSHCGRCSQCIDRRFSTLASSYFSHDPEEMYKVDLLTGKRETVIDQTLIESYAKTAKQIKEMSNIEFFKKYGEATRVLRHVGMSADKAALEILNLHRRHADHINSVLHNAMTRYSSAISAKKLPENCLVNMILPEEYKSGGKSDIPVFKKDGERWTLCFNGETKYVNHKVGMDYIEHLLRNPRTEFPVMLLELQVRGQLPPEKDNVDAKTSDDELAKQGMSIDMGDTQETVIDQQTVDECTRNIEELEEKLQRAKDRNDQGRIEEYGFELSNLKSYLSSSLGLDGKPRKVAGRTEKVRKKVLNAITRARNAIIKAHPNLGEHLKRSLETGNHMTYNPEILPAWDFGKQDKTSTATAR